MLNIEYTGIICIRYSNCDSAPLLSMILNKIIITYHRKNPINQNGKMTYFTLYYMLFYRSFDINA